MIYLDNNATTQIAPEVFEAMRPFLSDVYGNPSSSHTAGQESRNAVERSRESIATLVGAKDANEVVFTSGGTESDNWAIIGSIEADRDKRHIVTTRVEHEAVRKLCENLERKGFDVTWLDVDESGALDLDQLRDSLRADTAVVSVMLANNETGILFPVGEVAEIVKEKSDALFHVDAVNATGKIKIDVENSAIDLLSISAHKFHGPKGVGVLYIRDGVELPSMLIGGRQESGRRAGTEAVHQIAGLGAAAELARDLTPMESVRHLRDRLEDGILAAIPNASLNGTSDRSIRLPNTSNISFESINGEMILAKLDQLGICVSTGSACNSETRTASPVLQAMNIPYSKSMGSIRFSLGRYNSDAEIGLVIEKLPAIIDQLAQIVQ